MNISLYDMLNWQSIAFIWCSDEANSIDEALSRCMLGIEIGKDDVY